MGDGAGTLTESGATGELSLYNGDTPSFDTIVVPELGQEKALGTVLLMPSKTKEYELEVTLVALDENNTPTGKPEKGIVKINSKVDFAPNTKYKVTLTVYGLQIVQVHATLGKWETGEDITQEVN